MNASGQFAFHRTNSLFQGRTAVLATMHAKEQVIAPLLQQELGIQVEVPADFDTDRFGTFTRDIQRTGDQLATARLKAETAMQLTGCSIGLASEGSFAPHPVLPYLASNRELVILLDREHDLEVVGQAISTRTNYNHQQVSTPEEALAFAQKVGFPQHGLVVLAQVTGEKIPVDRDQIIKGITTEAQLIEAVNCAISQAGTAHLETDMRAMHNPTRMQVIAEATQDLIRKLQHTCPACDSPGFDVIERLPGLPCGLCSAPTTLTRAVIYHCQKCDLDQEVLFPEGKKTADPAQCAYCNP